MKKYLLFVLMSAFVSVGANAYSSTSGTKDTETVVDLVLGSGDNLKDALSGTTLTDCNYLRISSESTITLSTDDLDALAALTVTTLDMQNLQVASAFTFTNSRVENVILPDGWTKEEVTAAGDALKSNTYLNALISQTSTTTALSDGSTKTDATLIAYINKAGSLQTTLAHSGYDQVPNTKLGTGTGQCANLRSLTVIGNFCAKDISRAGDYDSNGHYIIHGTADENSQSFNMNTDGGKLYLKAESQDGAPAGALDGCFGLEVLDLSSGKLPDAWCTDLVVGYNGIPETNLKEVWLPEDPDLHTIPADYLNVNSNYLRQICIPSNITKIRTRAFAASGCNINYIWTKDITGTDTDTKFDNGAYFVSGDEKTLKYMVNPDSSDPENITFTDGDKNNFTYGTITLPPNLELIERFAFAGCNKVKDVYVLCKEAPQCHVDAFSTVLYVANTTYDKTLIKDGIITRDAYSMSGYQMMAVLHYPRDSKTPEIQRYTDPTRQYSVATGDRDGNGNTIYYPNQSEYNYAYAQGSYGYVWNAWNNSRNWYDNEIRGADDEGHKLVNLDFVYDQASHITGNGTSGQNTANQNWINNPNTAAKADRSFYDVTTGDYNASGEVAAPSGLEPYYNTYWEKNYLYPQAEMSTVSYYKYEVATAADFENGITVYTQSGSDYTEYTGSTVPEGTFYKRVQTQEADENGNPKFEKCDNGHYVQDKRYEEATDGEYVQVATPDGYSPVTASVVGVSTYYTDDQGTLGTPNVSGTYYYENGTDPVWQATQQPIDGVSQYYSSKSTSEGVAPTLNQPYYYATGGTMPTYSNEVYSPVTGVDVYYSDRNGTVAIPTLTTDNGDWYYNTGTTESRNIYTELNWKNAVAGVSTYYSDDKGSNQVLPDFSGTYYYKTGETITVYSYSSIDYKQPVDGVTQYYTLNDGVYTVVNPTFNGTYYTYDSETGEYSLATYWYSGTTYYTKANDDYVEVTPWLSGLYYYRVGDPHEEDEYLSTTKWVSGYNTYYSYDSDKKEYTEALPVLGGDYWYISGTEEVPVYQLTTQFVSGKYTYYKQYNAGVYTAVSEHVFN